MADETTVENPDPEAERARMAARDFTVLGSLKRRAVHLDDALAQEKERFEAMKRASEAEIDRMSSELDDLTSSIAKLEAE